MKIKKIERIKEIAAKACQDMSQEEMSILKGAINRQILVSAGKNDGKHFICPVTGKILKKRGAKKVIMESKRTRYWKSVSWIYLSKKAFNRITKELKA